MTPPLVRFFRSVVESDNGCWIRSDKDFRTTFWIDGKSVLAYRWIYEQVYGALASGEQLHHTCENARCVNPLHLQLMGDQRTHKKEHRWTHCKQGHEMKGDNVYVAPKTGDRSCAICKKARRKEQWRKRKK
jgi:hypothetical protein